MATKFATATALSRRDEETTDSVTVILYGPRGAWLAGAALDEQQARKLRDALSTAIEQMDAAARIPADDDADLDAIRAAMREARATRRAN